MSGALWFAIVIFSLIAPIVLSIFLYFLFRRRVFARKLSPASAYFLLITASLIFPVFSLFFTTLIASSFYNLFPALLPPSYDVAVPMGLVFLFYLSFFVSIASGSITLIAMRLLFNRNRP
jgi:hypothetical protein